MDLLKGIEEKGLLEVASRTRQHLSNIMRHAVHQVFGRAAQFGHGLFGAGRDNDLALAPGHGVENPHRDLGGVEPGLDRR
ncbi:hypothetical protein, partial [Pseudomonas aeruginosa]|uniref:hypothetical protein n=1 Tax=Pseudomonas aeruginosa TaxID=287 RepID=UPI003B026E30